MWLLYRVLWNEQSHIKNYILDHYPKGLTSTIVDYCTVTGGFALTKPSYRNTLSQCHQSYTPAYIHTWNREPMERAIQIKIHCNKSLSKWSSPLENCSCGNEKATCWSWNIFSLAHAGILHSSIPDMSQEGLIFYILCFHAW